MMKSLAIRYRTRTWSCEGPRAAAGTLTDALRTPEYMAEIESEWRKGPQGSSEKYTHHTTRLLREVYPPHRSSLSLAKPTSKHTGAH